MLLKTILTDVTEKETPVDHSLTFKALNLLTFYFPTQVIEAKGMAKWILCVLWRKENWIEY